MPRVSTPFARELDLPECLSALPFAAEAKKVRQLSGGRTSTVLLVALPGQASQIVVKLAKEDTHNPLFENRPQIEWAVLCALAQHGIAPMPVETRFLANRECCLVYQYVPGVSGAPSALDLARLLKRLHRIPPPNLLPRRAQSAPLLMQEAEKMTERTPLPHWAAALRPPCPTDINPVDPCLVHRDPIASNIVLTDAGNLILIDWQCPAIGDPVEDIAHATSPAMSYVYGSAETISVAAVISAYDDSLLGKRAMHMLPVYRWRMLCYCHWKANQGDKVYATAMEREAADLEQMQSNAHQKR